jgi:hypothetical protein
MPLRRWSFATLRLLALACSQPPDSPIAPATSSASERPANFANRVWRVARSSAVANGTLYAFLSDGTLVLTSPGNKPMLGSWSRTEDGLVMVEESIPYRVDILKLDDDEFVIRSHNPGAPVDIAMVPADSVDTP